MRSLFTLAALLMLALAGPALAAERVFAIGQIRVAEADIIDARAQPAIDGAPLILITLSDELIARITAMRAQSAEIIITLDGKPLAPLPELIEGDPTILIPGGTTIAEAEALAKLISGKEPLKDSLDESP